MSRRRSDAPLSRDPTAQPWRPVRLVQVDLDASGDPPLQGLLGERVWFEVRTSGQVIGVVEALVADEATLPSEVLAAGYGVVVTDELSAVTDAQLPTASVVIPTICSDPDELRRTVDALLAMDYPDFELVIVNNRPLQGVTIPELPGGDRVRVVDEPTAGISSARNRGTASSSGEIVAYTDDDAVVDPGWLRALGARFALDDAIEIVAGLVLPLEIDTEAQLWFEEFFGGFSRSYRPEVMSLERTAGSDLFFPYAPGRFGAGCNLAFRRCALERMGGFDTTLGVGTPAMGGEDLAMTFQFLVHGGTLAFEPAAIVRHSHRATRDEFMRQVLNYGTGLSAMYTSIIVHDPKHAVEMLRRAPAGLRLLTRPRDERSPSRAPTYPKRTLLYQMLGIAYGPIAYARSALRART